MEGSDIGSFESIVDVHEVMVIAVSDLFEIPRSHVLELEGDLMPCACVAKPLQRWSSIVCVDFKGIEHRPKRQGDSKYNFPESNPFSDSRILINDLPFLKINGRVWIHRRSLHERLELIPRMRSSHLNPHDFLKRGRS